MKINKKKVIMTIIIFVIIVLAVIFANIRVDVDKYGIEEIMESEILFQIDENCYETDIRMYSYKDGEGKEWIYQTNEHHIVLTKNGILCKYITGSYREEIPYSGYEIISKTKLSNKQKKEITKKIEELSSINVEAENNETQYTVFKNDVSKTVDFAQLNEILNQYAVNMNREINEEVNE